MALCSDLNRPINQSLVLWILLVAMESFSGSVAQFLCHEAFKNKTTAFSNLQFNSMPLLHWVAILMNNYLTHWAATPQCQTLCLHSDPSACTYDSISPCWLKATFPIVRGSPRSGPGWGSLPVACPRCLLGLVKDGWEWSKYCSSFPPDQYGGLGRLTRQTGPGIKTQTLFHGGLALSLSLDYNCRGRGGSCLGVWFASHVTNPFFVRYDFGDLLRKISIKKEKLIIGVNV